MSAKKWGPDVAALRHRDFALYVSANFLTTIALQIQATALAWQIYAITNDPFQLGLVGLAEFLPAALLALPAGHLADRIDRRLLILIGVTAELFAALALVFLASTDRITEVAILALALCFGIARAIATPAARALMPNLMPKEHLAKRGRLVLDQLAGRDDRRPGRWRRALFGHRRPARAGNASGGVWRRGTGLRRRGPAVLPHAWPLGERHGRSETRATLWRSWRAWS